MALTRDACCSRSCLAAGGTGSWWRSREWRTSARGSSGRAPATSPSPSSTSASSSGPSRVRSSRPSSPWSIRWVVKHPSLKRVEAVLALLEFEMLIGVLRHWPE